MGLLMALLMLALGLALLFAGYRKARTLIPLWVFASGFSAGVTIISDLSGTPVLGALLSLLVGFVIGLGLAAMSYLYYNVAVIALGGLLGYWLGSSAMMLLGMEPGFMSTVIGSVIGVVFGIGALFVNEPKYVLITLASFAGAVTAVGCFMILLGSVSSDDLNYATNQSTISDAGLWLLFTMLLTALGMAAQSMMQRDFVIKKWARGQHDDDARDERPATPAAPMAPPPAFYN